MRIVLRLFDGSERAVLEPYPGSQHAIATGACPEEKCGANPLTIAGGSMRVVDDRRYEADGVCLACMTHVGRIVAFPATLFGIAEDTAVLVNGRCRVY